MRKFLLLGLLVPLLAAAEITPPKGNADSRVRIVDYNPLNVVKLSTFYGVSTHVQFGESETIRDVAVGDDLAWRIVPRGSHLFIKPQATKADTNVTVVTDKHTYQFALMVQPRQSNDPQAWKDPNLIFSLVFHYPDDEAAKIAASASSATQKARAIEVKARLGEALKAGENFNYWVAGAEEVSPTAAHDDGRFIYLRFNNNRDMPAVYSVGEDGKEALINTNVINGNTIVVQRLVRRLMLRRGSAVASIWNQSFDLNAGPDNATGTVSAAVERIVKEPR